MSQTIQTGQDGKNKARIAREIAAQDLAARAAVLATSITGYTFVEGDCELVALKHLFVNTGGSLFAYTHDTMSQLPQDVYAPTLLLLR